MLQGAFAPAQTAAEPPPSTYSEADQPISAGDIVAIALQEDNDVRYEGTINQSGVVNLKYLGDFRIAGMTPREVEKALKTRFEEDLYQRATLSVHLVSRAPGSVYVYGAVQRPGALELPLNSRITILQALSKAGGITAWANPRNCTVTRANADGVREQLPVDLEQAFKDIGGQTDRVLQSGDVVFVPAANPETMQVLTTEPCEVIVVGEINAPGIIRFAPGESRTIMRAIFKAGNFTRFAKKSEVRLVRYSDGNRDVRLVDVGKVVDEGFMQDDVELKPGDMIIVDQKLFSFSN